MVSVHSSSASLSSSLSFSRTSHTSSISSSPDHSSPSSSPDSVSSAHIPSLASSAPKISSGGGSSSAVTDLQRTSASPPHTLVPFSWEEKPGVLKKGIMQSSCHHHHHHHRLQDLSIEDDGSDSLPSCLHANEPDFCICTNSDDGLMQAPMKYPSALSAQRRPSGEDLPRIRLPPCLSHTEHLHSCNARQGSTDKHRASQESHRQPQQQFVSGSGTSVAGAGSKFISGLSLPKRRLHRSTLSLDDDPFWLAMVACTNDTDKGSAQANGHRKGLKGFLSGKISRTDSWLARRVVQESIHFDHCAPHQTSRNHAGGTRRINSSRGGDGAVNPAGHDADNDTASCTSARRVHYMERGTHLHSDTDAGTTAVTHSAGKTPTALHTATAKAELHGRSKTILSEQQSPPLVDISCGSRGGSSRSSSSSSSSKSKRGFGAPKRHKLPDLFGCKSNHALIFTSSFP